MLESGTALEVVAVEHSLLLLHWQRQMGAADSAEQVGAFHCALSLVACCFRWQVSERAVAATVHPAEA